MRVYIVEYRYYAYGDGWISKISQEGYASLEKAQEFVKSRTDGFRKVTEMCYQNNDTKEKYFIHDIYIGDAKE